jgi:hypothetical protein
MSSGLPLDACCVQSRGQQRASGREATGAARQPGSLDLKLLRMAVHGWWLGNPLVYKPETSDLDKLARELAGAGAQSGTLVLGHGWSADATAADPDGEGWEKVRLMLILRPKTPRAQTGMAAALTMAEVAQEAARCACTIQHHWEVVLERGHTFVKCR